MKDGLMPVVALAGGVSVTLLWSMSANDPYWRLFETPSVPVPAYETSDDQGAAKVIAALSLGNADTGAVSPAADPLADSRFSEFSLDTVVRVAEAAAIPDPMIALVAPFEPEPMTSPAFDSMIAYELPRVATTALPEPDTDTDVVIAFAPIQLQSPALLRDRSATAVTGNALGSFMAPSAPAQPRFAASEFTEETLELTRAERVDVQRRLALAGFDPEGIDGEFGPRTRAALSDFQTAWGFPATGYLETAVYADLNQRTEDAYQALRRQAAAAPSSAPELAPIALERQLASIEDDDRCARRIDGQIIERQSLACDLAGFGEQFVSLGRNILNDGDDDTAPARVIADTVEITGTAKTEEVTVSEDTAEIEGTKETTAVEDAVKLAGTVELTDQTTFAPASGTER